MSELEEILRKKYVNADDWTDQPQPKDWGQKTPLEKAMALNNRDLEYMLTENILDTHTSLASHVLNESLTRYERLREVSPTLRAQTRCAEFFAKSEDSSRRDSMKNRMASIKCFAELYKLTPLLNKWEACIENCMGNFRRCAQETEDIERTIAEQYFSIDALFKDKGVLDISYICAKEAFLRSFSNNKAIKAQLACIGPKYCPALFREVFLCFINNNGTSRPCTREVRNYLACIADFDYKPNERFYTSIDRIPNYSVPHPSILKELEQKRREMETLQKNFI